MYAAGQEDDHEYEDGEAIAPARNEAIYSSPSEEVDSQYSVNPSRTNCRAVSYWHTWKEYADMCSGRPK